MLGDSLEVRLAIYADLLEASDGGRLPLTRDQLLGYRLDGERFPLIDAQGRGIRNPADWPATLSITSSEDGRYDDLEVAPGVWMYPLALRRGPSGPTSDPSNVKFLHAHRSGTPVLYFYKPVPYTYLLAGLVKVAHIDEASHTARIELLKDPPELASSVEAELERIWVERVVHERLHQPRFREIVLRAYASRCAVCELPEPSLLDAAHIRGDRDPNGQAVIPNGLALCAIHHRAFDARLIGIDPDLTIHVLPSLKSVEDGPTFEHGIKALDGARLANIPRAKGDRPDPFRLELTFKEFRAAAGM